MQNTSFSVVMQFYSLVIPKDEYWILRGWWSSLEEEEDEWIELQWASLSHSNERKRKRILHHFIRLQLDICLNGFQPTANVLNSFIFFDFFCCFIFIFLLFSFPRKAVKHENRKKHTSENTIATTKLLNIKRLARRNKNRDQIKYSHLTGCLWWCPNVFLRNKYTSLTIFILTHSYKVSLNFFTASPAPETILMGSRRLKTKEIWRMRDVEMN